MATLWRLSYSQSTQTPLAENPDYAKLVGAVDMVEILHKQFAMYATDATQVSQTFTPLPTSIPMNRVFLPVGEHISEQTAHVAKLLPTIPGILPLCCSYHAPPHRETLACSSHYGDTTY